MAEPRAFGIKVEDDVLVDLRARLARARWPDEVPGGGWGHGTDLGYMKALVQHWRERYDWRAHEARLNRFRHFTVALDGVDLHFIHEPGRGPAPMPLLLSHGWPGSIAEFETIIPMLTDPAAFGGDPADAFTVVVPSLPGYGFSFRPGQPRFDIAAIADDAQCRTLVVARDDVEPVDRPVELLQARPGESRDRALVVRPMLDQRVARLSE